jgi:hypothetical protein
MVGKSVTTVVAGNVDTTDESLTTVENVSIDKIDIAGQFGKTVTIGIKPVTLQNGTNQPTDNFGRSVRTATIRNGGTDARLITFDLIVTTITNASTLIFDSTARIDNIATFNTTARFATTVTHGITLSTLRSLSITITGSPDTIETKVRMPLCGFFDTACITVKIAATVRFGMIVIGRHNWHNRYP